MVWKPYDATISAPMLTRQDNFSSNGVKTVQQDNVGCKNLMRGWKKKILARTLWRQFLLQKLTKRCDKTILAPIVRKPYDKTILAGSITFPSQSDRSPVYLEDGNLPLAPPREYILVITSPWLTRPQEKEARWAEENPTRQEMLAIHLWCNIVGLAITPNTTWETTNSKLLWGILERTLGVPWCLERSQWCLLQRKSEGRLILENIKKGCSLTSSLEMSKYTDV